MRILLTSLTTVAFLVAAFAIPVTPSSGHPNHSIKYSGAQSLNAAPLKDADARIEQPRKPDFTVRVVDDSGVPVPDAPVRVEQIRHKFLFGCNAFPLLNHTEVDMEA